VNDEPSMADVWAEIDAGQQADVLEPGERTLAEIAKAWGVSHQSANSRASGLIRAGVMTRRQVRLVIGGKIKHAFAYRPAKGV
jgi:predicted transcriptional regulator